MVVGRRLKTQPARVRLFACWRESAHNRQNLGCLFLCRATHERKGPTLCLRVGLSPNRKLLLSTRLNGRASSNRKRHESVAINGGSLQSICSPISRKFSQSDKSPTHSPNSADTSLSRFLGSGRI